MRLQRERLSMREGQRTMGKGSRGEHVIPDGWACSLLPHFSHISRTFHFSPLMTEIIDYAIVNLGNQLVWVYSVS